MATVIDLATRMVLGWQLADHMRTTLIVDALQMAVTSGHIQPGAVFHSDRGGQLGFKGSLQHRCLREHGSPMLPADRCLDARSFPVFLTGAASAGAQAEVKGRPWPTA